MSNDLKKLVLCLKWDIDNIEDLNNKRDYLSGRVADIQELVKNCSIPNVSKCCNAMCDEPVHKEGSVYCEFHKDL